MKAAFLEIRPLVNLHLCCSAASLRLGRHQAIMQGTQGEAMKAAVAAILLTIAGCGAFDRSIATATGFARSCVDGVLYYQFTSGVTVAYEPSGKIKTCS